MKPNKTVANTISASLFVLFVFAWAALGVSGGIPTDNVRETVDKVLAILKDPQLQSPTKTRERREQLRQVIYSRFDFAEMARRSLGNYWRQRTPEEQKEFVQLFTDLLERAYVSKIEAYDDETFVYRKERRDGDFAEVNSRILTRKGEEYSLNYRHRLVDGDWKVYDVVVENISLVNNYP
ncbi:MAG: ABC transporter substrate-binding protein [Deltaproteobacteria bacterium]|nr:MAG: ABC transporter substrate-binding protein [Deltaproteobacteria bacterium]